MYVDTDIDVVTIIHIYIYQYLKAYSGSYYTLRNSTFFNQGMLEGLG